MWEINLLSKELFVNRNIVLILLRWWLHGPFLFQIEQLWYTTAGGGKFARIQSIDWRFLGLMCRRKPCLGVTGALSLVFFSFPFCCCPVGSSYDLLFLYVPRVSYITYFHWPAPFFSWSKHTHTHRALTYFIWIIQLEIRQAVGHNPPLPGLPVWVFFRGLDFIIFSVRVQHAQCEDSRAPCICLHFKACQFNVLLCEEWTLGRKDKGRGKKEQKEKERKR